MSNPQIKSLETAGTLNQVRENIIEILTKYSNENIPLCSHEILGLANCSTIKAIAEGITANAGGYSIPSSWIGSVASDMANSNKITQKNKKCIYNLHIDEAWHT